MTLPSRTLRALRLPTPRSLGYTFSWTGRIGLAVILFWGVIALIGSP